MFSNLTLVLTGYYFILGQIKFMEPIISQTKVIKIGNSMGIVIPKRMLSTLGDTVRLKLENESILIEPIQR